MNEQAPTTSILVVDDEPLIRWGIAESLSSAGYHVMEAHDARSAIELMELAQPAVRLALLDLRLPDSRDLGLLRKIKRLSPGCQVIMMTAHGTPDLMDTAVRDGARTVLGKPFDMQMLVGLVRTTLATAT